MVKIKPNNLTPTYPFQQSNLILLEYVLIVTIWNFWYQSDLKGTVFYFSFLGGQLNLYFEIAFYLKKESVLKI